MTLDMKHRTSIQNMFLREITYSEKVEPKATETSLEKNKRNMT